MKKKVIYKVTTKYSIEIETENIAEEKLIEELNKEFERQLKQDKTYHARTVSLEYLNHKIKKTGILDDFVYNLKTMLNDKSPERQADELVKEINVLENKKRPLLEIRLEGIITKEDFEIQYKSISEKIETKNEQLSKVNSEITNKDIIAIRIEDLRKIISFKTIERFDSDTFELLIDTIIVGGYDEKGKQDPYLLEYKFKLNYNYKINGQAI